MQTFAIITFLITSVAFSTGQPVVERFATRPTLPVKVDLLLSGYVTKHVHNGGNDTISAIVTDNRGLDEGTAGVTIRVSSDAGKLLWQHNFGFNLSSLPSGNSASVSCHPGLPLILVSHHGYKWDNSGKLLLFDHAEKGPVVREYISATQDLLPELKKQEGFPADYKYWIFPRSFSEKGVIFSCVPMQKAEAQAAHPVAQDQPWYQIEGMLGQDFHIIPIKVSESHGE